MGRQHYLGGSTQVYVYDKKNSLIKKIYHKLKTNIAHDYLSIANFNEFFYDYKEDELQDILEDVTYNYNQRRNYWLNQIKRASR